MTRRLIAPALAAALVISVAGCSSTTTSEQPSATATPRTTAAPTLQETALPSPVVSSDATTGLTVPWGVAVLPNGTILVAERVAGQVLRLPQGGGTPTVLGTVPGVRAEGEGGLLGLAVSPGFANDALLYAYLTTDTDNRVVTMTIKGNRLGPPRAIVTGIPQGSIHDGGRIAFGPDGKLWITTGDAGVRELAQDRDNLAGKILRAEPDGSVPSDNPFGTLVWSYGHRNVQGIAWDSQGQPWATEFGPSSVDELNLIRKGANYGWPVVEGAARQDGFEDPAVTWPTDQASPSGIAIVDDVAYVGALRGQRLWQVPLRGSEAGESVAQLEGTLGRIRTVEVAANGQDLLVTTSNRDGRGNPGDNDDRVVRVSLNRS